VSSLFEELRQLVHKRARAVSRDRIAVAGLSTPEGIVSIALNFKPDTESLSLVSILKLNGLKVNEIPGSRSLRLRRAKTCQLPCS